jgi:ESCRT-I complex subunit TSG101
MGRLVAVRDVCSSVADKVGGVVNEAERRVAELEAKGEVSVDEVVCGISIVHNQ